MTSWFIDRLDDEASRMSDSEGIEVNLWLKILKKASEIANLEGRKVRFALKFIKKFLKLQIQRGQKFLLL